MGWPLFLLEPTDWCRAYLRRYVPLGSGNDCLGRTRYHNALTFVGDVVVKEHLMDSSVSDELKLDPRWPARCSCGYEFAPEDRWQYFREQVWRAADGRMMTISEAPAGACWSAHWMKGVMRNNRDQPHHPLVIKLPGGGEWCADGPSTNGNGWTRTGDLNNMTVKPSIGHPSYHGWLENGSLGDDLEGRTYST